MDRVYLDHAAATPLRPEVARAVRTVQDRLPGNPSASHRWGREAREELEDARERVGRALGVPPRSVHFVRGGTESDNLAVLGRADRVRARGETPVLVRSGIEHSAVRESVTAAVAAGGREEILSVRADGTVDEGALDLLLQQRPHLVSVMWVNHETGTILPVGRVADRCREAGVAFHVDAVQAVGRIPVEASTLPIDLLSVSGHKLGGPPGTGVLVVRDRDLLAPRLFGGGQEGGLRPGTEDVAGAVGMAVALEGATAWVNDEASRLARLRFRLEEGLRAGIPALRVHGREGPRAPHILSVGVPGLPRDVLPGALDLEGVGVSAGSACRTGSTTVSPVLAALYGEAAAEVAPLRLSLGWTTREEDVERALDVIPAVVDRVRAAGLAAGGD
jgi:cysteine desulfurase